ncbi:homoserine kinase [Acidihalobacter ferrooxydans]|uniref:Homoserine kinase n=1 Tax=Acidihalobacter ferrooxydans TaxID=1765967 RepID=A0A1P8UCZ6_9GAMM|nr:homoserine kinase [Acidihalobacter ferrooxydans]APZ41731.1 homoserine kinase [Acidihalobacter ferrooxydans]
MSVFTPVSETELQVFLADYALGEVTEFVGIGSGIENTNFFVSTTQGRYVLTLFEQHEAESMPYFIDLMAWLNEHSVPCAHPIADQAGVMLKTLNGRPAALVQRLSGESNLEPDAQACATLGTALGQLHEAAADFPGHRDNDRGPRWWREMADRLLPQLDKDDAKLLREELRFQGLYRFSDLPRGVIHADLFRDNVLWVDDALSGIIDFYYACNDTLLYDVAVTANDWCTDTQGILDPERTRALLEAYHAVRPFKPIERGAWPVMLRAAALRFWLSRLRDKHFPRPAEIGHIKDPNFFKTILRAHIEHEHTLHKHWI